MREIQDDGGARWEVMALEETVAHGRRGARLGFRAAGEGDSDPLRTPVTFNSPEAAAAAIRTMGEKELRRRLSLALVSAGRA